MRWRDWQAWHPLGCNPCGAPPRSWATYVKAGHFGHVHVPGNDHVDPQVKNGSLLFDAAPKGGFLMALTDKQQADLYDKVMNDLLDKADGSTLRKDIGFARDQILGSNDPAKIAAAIPAEIAQQVLDALAAKLNAKE